MHAQAAACNGASSQDALPLCARAGARTRSRQNESQPLLCALEFLRQRKSLHLRAHQHQTPPHAPGIYQSRRGVQAKRQLRFACTRPMNPRRKQSP